MRVYVVSVNGTISSIGYNTLEKAQEFCKNRSDKPEMVGNGWCFISPESVYRITDVMVKNEK